MKYVVFLTVCTVMTIFSMAQASYDSISISRFYIKEEMYGANWRDTLKLGRFPVHVHGEETVWIKSSKLPGNGAGIIPLANRIKANGTADVANCFIPRHSINYYKGGTITRYLLICFECDGVRFSDDPKNTFIKSIPLREKQMAELKALFTGKL